jgi:hypothetical protein
MAATCRLICCLYITHHRGPMVIDPDYRSRGARFDSRSYQIFGKTVVLERGSLSLVRTNDKLFE